MASCSHVVPRADVQFVFPTKSRCFSSAVAVSRLRTGGLLEDRTLRGRNQFLVQATSSASPRKRTSSNDVPMVDPLEAKRLAALQMQEIQAKKRFKVDCNGERDPNSNVEDWRGAGPGNAKTVHWSKPGLARFSNTGPSCLDPMGPSCQGFCWNLLGCIKGQPGHLEWANLTTGSCQTLGSTFGWPTESLLAKEDREDIQRRPGKAPSVCGSPVACEHATSFGLPSITTTTGGPFRHPKTIGKAGHASMLTASS